MKKKILVTGGLGQVGSELVPALEKKYGKNNVIIFDKKEKGNYKGLYIKGDVVNKKLLEEIIKKYKINEIYHLASLLSVTGEQNPELAWSVNVEGLRNILECARIYNIKVFWPSSIAVFGNTTPQDKTPQKTILEPTTIYGVTKVSGELLCQYYFKKYKVDVRSVRYPGIISWKTIPGGGTTDYAIDIFWHALTTGNYTCFLNKNTALPMMYIDDAIKATIDIMEVPAKKITIHTSYNISSFSCTPELLATAIRKQNIPLKMKHSTDIRQSIADSWPNSIDDKQARKDWKWKPVFDIKKTVKEMLEGVAKMQSNKK